MVRRIKKAPTGIGAKQNIYKVIIPQEGRNMTENVKYTLESTIDNSERELFQVDDDLERMERELNELSIYRFNLVKNINEHKQVLLELYPKEE